jgi:hypothetical protein
MESGYDFDYVEYSLNGGGSWTAVEEYTGLLDTWTQESLAIPALDGDSNASFRFRMYTDETMIEDGWHIDDVHLSYIPYQCTFPIDAPSAPVLLTPPDETMTTTHTVTLEWMQGEGNVAQAYELELDGEVVTTTETAYSTLLDAGTHTWRVRASNVWGDSPYSVIWSFEIVDLAGAPSLVSPLKGAVVGNPVSFEWSPSPEGSPPSGYIFFLDDTAVMTFTEPVTSTEMTLELGEHTWSVSAINFAGVTPAAESRSLTVTDIPGVPLLISPADGTVAASNQVNFTWEPSASGGETQGYHFMLDGEVALTFNTPVTSTTLTLDPGVHTWSVAAFNAGGSSAFASEWMLEVPFRVPASHRKINKILTVPLELTLPGEHCPGECCIASLINLYKSFVEE